MPDHSQHESLGWDIGKWFLAYLIVFTAIWGVCFDRVDARCFLIAGVVAAGICLTARYLLGHPRCQAFLTVCFGIDKTPVAPPARRAWLWCLAGAAVVIGNFALLEADCHYFFTQDDNFSFFLPNLLFAYRHLFHGTLPTWNAFQYLGIPAASNPQCSFFYPPMIASYLFAKHVLRNEMATIEIYSFLHLLGGYFILFALLRALRVRPAYAMVGGVAFALSGFFLIMGRSWSSFPFYVIYEALLVLLLLALQRGEASWRWMLLTGGVIGLSLYLGCPQMWAYLLFFFLAALGIMVASGVLPRRRAWGALPAVLLGIGLAMPLLLPQFCETMRFINNREMEFGEGVGPGLLAMLAPYPLSHLSADPGSFSAQTYGPIGWGKVDQQYMTQFYYSGSLHYLLAALLLLAACGYLVTRRVVRENVWLSCALLAGNLAMGITAGGWVLISLLPVFNKFRGPFKILGFLNLFVIIGTSIVIERLLRRYRLRASIEYGVVAIICLLLTYHCSQPHPAFFRYADKPYPTLPREYAPLLAESRSLYPSRVISLSPFRDIRPHFVWTLGLTFPTVYRIPALTGYDPLLSHTPEMEAVDEKMGKEFVTALQAYGVKWVLLVPRTAGCSPPLRNYLLHHPQVTVQAHITRDGSFPIDLLQVASAAPFAFFEGNLRAALPVHLYGDGLAVDLPGHPRAETIIVNYTPAPAFVARADGRPVAINADSWGRMRLQLPPGARHLRLTYRPPWEKASLIGLALALIAGVLFVFIRRLK